MFGFVRKIGMTRIWVDGKQIPVTALEVPTSFVLQKKNNDKDGYEAVQLGAFPRTKADKPTAGHTKKYTGEENSFKALAEFRIDDLAEDKKFFDIEDFIKDGKLIISGDTIGRGFTGAVKRWGFAGQPASHGHDHERAVGSIGALGPQRVMPGQKMAGHHGASQKTLRGVEIVDVDVENKLIFVHGSVPGANGHHLKVRKY